MSVHPRNTQTNRYPLFHEIFGNTKESTVLDFGGSSGNLLYFSNGNIKEENYTCIDIVENAIMQGRAEFSNAEFIHNNRYNWMYNHAGNRELKFPNVNKNQDYIWAYSVFSHTDLDEFIQTIKWFTTFNFKKIAVSFLTFNEMLVWAYNKRYSEYGECVDIKKYHNTTCYNTMYLFDNNKVTFDNSTLANINCKYLLTFYNTNWLIERLAQEGLNINIVYPGDGYVPFLYMEKK
jgi:SAM-dependent methyltransferase